MGAGGVSSTLLRGIAPLLPPLAANMELWYKTSVVALAAVIIPYTAFTIYKESQHEHHDKVNYPHMKIRHKVRNEELGKAGVSWWRVGGTAAACAVRSRLPRVNVPCNRSGSSSSTPLPLHLSFTRAQCAGFPLEGV